MKDLFEFASFASTARDRIPSSKVDWSVSPFGWMRHHGPRTKSKMGRDIAQTWLEARGVKWEPSENGVAHLFVPEMGNVVVHLSLLGKEGLFEFSNLREPGLGTDAIWLIGIEPLRVRLWGVKPSSCVGLPTYSSDQPGYHHYNFDPEDPPQWMKLLDEWSDQTLEGV